MSGYGLHLLYSGGKHVPCDEASKFERTRWLDLGRLHVLLTGEVKKRETTYERHCVTYAAWFQGISGSEVGADALTKDRDLYHDLIREGIHPTLLPMSSGRGRWTAREKGVDVALAISAMEVAFTNRVDLIALVTGDADFVPLVWALKRRGLRVGVFGFNYGADGSDGDREGGIVAP
jgi:hypothetical protein